MRTTITIDDKLLARAQEYSGITQKSALIKEALTLLVQRGAALELSKMGGTMPELRPIPRRRSAL